MKNILAVHFGRVKDGKLLIRDKAKFETNLTRLEGREVELTIAKYSDTRTNAENRYYWGVIVAILADEMGLTPDDTHALLKSMFLKIGVEVKGGKRYEVVRSTASLSIDEFEDYCTKCRDWAAAELNCLIPLPGEASY